MGKMVGIAEFKANCTRLISEMERDGEPILVTRRGKVVGVLSPPVPEQVPESLFGALKGMVVRYDDPFGPIDPDWEAKWEAGWDALGFPAPGAKP